MVSLGLTLCPYCGRSVRPAGPRWGWWIAGLAAVVLVSLWGLNKLPIARAVQEVQAFRESVAGLIEVLGPVSTPSPAPVEPMATVALLALATETPAPTNPPPSLTPSPEAATAEVVKTAEVEAALEEPEATPTDQVSGTPTPAVTSAIPTGSPTPAFTSTPTPTPTAVPPSPTATQTAARPTASGTTTYRVQAGDTLSSIAARFGITWEVLAAANGLTGNSVLRIGQELIIPASGAAPPTATATPLPRPTATPVPPTPTPQPQLAAPMLVNPGDQSGYSGAEAFIVLTWEPVAGMVADNQYQVIVRWVEQGAPQVWDRGFTTAREMRVPLWLWGKADQPARQYTWYVQVVQVTTDGRGGERVIPLSPPSSSRVFYWN
ncbi:MAG: LysM peptidoglycan-binding domain-containing protein [Anaerolineae bacterium]